MKLIASGVLVLATCAVTRNRYLIGRHISVLRVMVLDWSCEECCIMRFASVLLVMVCVAREGGAGLCVGWHHVHGDLGPALPEQTRRV